MDEVLHQAAMIEKYGEVKYNDIDYTKAASYCNSILKNCKASVHYICLRIEYLLKSFQLKEAETFSEEVLKRPEIQPDSKLNAIRARVVLYSGNEKLGKKLLV